MIKVPRTDRKAIDQWPIATAGLPARVVHSLKKTEIRTVGDLRRSPTEALQKLRGIGAVSIEDIDSFFKICEKIETGALSFATTKDSFLFFVAPVQFEVLAMRYGLTDDSPASGATLQAVGAKRGITRERARQMEKSAKAILQSHLAQACLKSLYALFEDFIDRNHGVVFPEDLASLESHELLAGLRTERLLLLLSDCGQCPSRIRGVFTNLPRSEVERLAAETLKLLESRAAEPRPLSDILEHFAPCLEPFAPETRQRLLQSLLDRLPSVSATEDDRYFLFPQGASHIIREILARHGRPMHFQGITREFNTILRPGNRKGTGHVLDILRKSPQFSSITSGCYRLKGTDPARERNET